MEPKNANEMLCEQFWSDLRPELRAGTEHKFDSIAYFDKLRLELRIVETDGKLCASSSDSRTSGPAAKMSISADCKISDAANTELKDLIAKLSHRLDSL